MRLFFSIYSLRYLTLLIINSHEDDDVQHKFEYKDWIQTIQLAHPFTPDKTINIPAFDKRSIFSKRKRVGILFHRHELLTAHDKRTSFHPVPSQKPRTTVYSRQHPVTSFFIVANSWKPRDSSVSRRTATNHQP